MPHPLQWFPSSEVCDWLRSKYEYNPETGVIRDKEKNRVPKLKRATNHYLLLRLTNSRLSVRRYVSAHRLAWFLANGSFPIEEIDHINHDKRDQRLTNLRLATHTNNHANKPKSKKSIGGEFSSKYRGIHWAKKDKRWIAQIRIDGKNRHIGYFRSEDEAAEAYNKKALEVFGEFANLNQFV